MRSRNEVPTGPKEELFVLAIPIRVATGSPSLNFQRFLECSSVDEGRSIVPNRSELEATAAGKTKQPKSRKTPPLKRRVEPLGTMALHWKNPPLAVGKPLGTSA